ncbi:hypothetical protein RQP46_007249 [Phenoliferia psychrophenolica]
MRSFIVTLAALVAICTAAPGNLDYSHQDASYGPETGNYLIRNVATGAYLYFARDGVVGAYLGDVKSGINIETATYEGVTGVILKGTTTDTLKCLAAQWNFKYNKLAKLGSSGDGTYGSDSSGNDSDKEFWLLNAVPGHSAPDPAPAPATTTTSRNTVAFTKPTPVPVVVPPTTTSTTEAPPTTTAAPPPPSVTTTSTPPPPSPPAPTTTTAEPAPTPARAPLGALNQLGAHSWKRSDSTYYTIHPINHLNDMQTVALGGTPDTGFGGMPAVRLDIADVTNQAQWWTIELMD